MNKLIAIITLTMLMTLTLAGSTYSPIPHHMLYPTTINTQQTYSISTPVQSSYYINHIISPIKISLSIPSQYQTIPWVQGASLVQQTECEWLIVNSTIIIDNSTPQTVIGQFYNASLSFTPTTGGKYGIAGICLTEHTNWNATSDTWTAWSSPITCLVQQQ